MLRLKQLFLTVIFVVGAFTSSHAQSGWTSQTSGIPSSLMSVVWANNQFLAVGGTYGSNARVLTSPDGVTWTERTSGGTDRLYEVIWTGTQYVAVGLATANSGIVLTSPDGITWTTRTNSISNGLRAVTWTGSLYVAVGNAGIIRTSMDAITWTTRTSPVGNLLHSVTWTGNQFVSVGTGGNIVTSPNGTSWTKQTSPTTKLLTEVVWTGSQLVAVGDSGVILTSPDAITWTPRTSSSPLSLQGLTWTGRQLIAVGGDDLSTGIGTISLVVTSPDGINWTTRPTSAGKTLNSVVGNGMKFVVGGAVGTIITSPDSTPPLIATSPQGQSVNVGTLVKLSVSASAGTAIPITYTWLRTKGGIVDTLKKDTLSVLQDTLTIASASTSDSGSYSVIVKNLAGSVTSGAGYLFVGTIPVSNIWTAQNSGKSNELSSVVWGNNQFLAVGGWFGQYPTVLTSPDGVTWTERNTGHTDQLYDVVWTGTQYAAVGLPTSILTSPDGITWTTRTTTTNGLRSVAWTGSQFVAVGNSGVIYTSPTGVTWTKRTSPVGNALFSVTAAGSQVVAVGLNGNIVTSPDGITWTKQTSPTSSRLMSVAWTGSQLVASGDTGVVLTSPDGVTWTPRTSGSGYNLEGMIWTGSDLVVVGGDDVGGHGTHNTILSSPDGITWTSRLTGAGTPLNSIAWSGSKFAAVGNEGAVITSAGVAAAPVVSTNPQGQTIPPGSQVKLSVKAAAGASVPLIYTWLRTRGGITDTVQKDTTYMLSDTLSIVSAMLTDSGSYLAVVKNGAGSVTSASALVNVSGPGFTPTIWTVQNLGTTDELYTVIWGNNEFMGVGGSYGNTTRVMTSPDGLTWTERNSGGTHQLYNAVWTGSQYVVVGLANTSTGSILTSPDGINWTTRTVPASTGGIRSVTWTGTLLVTVGNGGVILTSSDGISWTKRTSPFGNVLYWVTWTGTQLVAVGTNGNIATSPDGISWTARTSGTTNRLHNVVWTGTQLVAVGESGIVLTSPTGITWTTRTSGTTVHLQGLAWTGAQLVAVGGDDAGTSHGNTHVILTSNDGITWTPRLTGKGKSLHTVAFNSNKFVAVGVEGALLTTSSVEVAPVVSTNPLSTTVVSGAQVRFAASATFGASLPFVYNWVRTRGAITDTLAKDTTSLLQDTLTMANVFLADTGSYTAVLTNGGGSASTTAALLTINTTPTISSQPRDTTVVSGSPASFTVLPASGPGSSAGTLSYQWKKNGTNVSSNGTSATYNLASVAITDTASYSVVVTRTLNATTTSTTSTVGKLFVNVAPTITSQPRDTTGVLGANVSFTVAAGSGPGSMAGTLSYQWKKDGTNVASGGTSPNLPLNAVSIADTGLYTVVVTRTLGTPATTTSTTSNAVLLRVNVAPVIASQPRDTTVISGSSTGTAFTVVATLNNGSSAGTFSYQWKKNGTNVVSGGTSATYTVSTATISDTGSYTVVVTRSLGTPTTTTSIISSAGILRVNIAPTISVQPRDTAVAAGVPGTFSVSASVVGGGVLSYQWKKNGVNVSTGTGGTSATYSTNPTAITDTGSYTVTVTSTLNANTTSTTSTVGKLLVNAAPVISSQPRDTTVLSGSSTGTAFTVVPSADNGSSAGTFSYQWKKNGTNVVSGGTLATYTISSATIADTGSYTVVVTRSLGNPVTTTSTTSAAGVLRVNVAPTISTQPRDTTVIAGVAGTFSVGASVIGGGVLSYQWKKNGVDVSSGTGGITAIYSTNPAAITDTGSYTVVATSTLNGNSSSTTSAVGKLFVNSAPTISAQPRDTTVSSGSSTGTAFTVAIAADNGSSAGTFSYQWKKNGVNVLSGGTSLTYTVASATVTDTGSYTVLVTRTLGAPATTTSTTSSAGILRVNAAPAISSQPRDTTVIAGVAGTFSVSANVVGGGTLSYQWKKNGVNVSSGTGGTTATYSTTPSSLADTGSYSVVVTSTLNANAISTTSSAGILSVNAAPVIASQPRDTTVLTGTSTGTAFSVTALVDNGSSAGTFSYQWKKNGVNVSTGGTEATYTIASATIVDTGSYTVVVTRSLGTPSTTTTTTSSGARVFINAPPTITPPRDTAVIAGLSGTFSVTAGVIGGGGVLSYQWKKDGVNVSTGTGGTTPSYSTAASTLADTGSYTVVVTSTVNANAVSTTSSTGLLRVNVAPVISAQPRDTTVVAGTSTGTAFTVAATVNNGSSAGTFSYQWKKNGTNVSSGGTSATYTIASATIADTGSYTVVVTRSLGTPATTTSTTSSAGKLSVNVAPAISVQPHDTTVVAGVAGTFSVTASPVGGGTLSYKWQKGGVDISGATLSTYSTAAAALADSGSYAVVVTSTLGVTSVSTTSSTGKLFVNTKPSFTSQPRDTTVVVGGRSTFSATVAAGVGTSAGTYTYQWKKNGANVVKGQGSTSATLTVDTAAATDSGSYRVVVTRTLNGTSTVDSSSLGKLSINVAPTISVQPHDTTVIAGVVGTFSVSASALGGAALSYQWKKNGTDIAGATSASYSTAAATIADTGSYSVVVTSTLNLTTSSTTSSAGKLSVNVAPTIATQPVASQATVVGQNATMTVVAAAGGGTSAGTLTYQWRKNGTNLTNGAVTGAATVSGATTASLTLTGLAAADSGSYTVIITRSLNGTTTSATSSVSLLTAPVGILPGAFVIRVNGQEKPYAFQLPAGTATEKLTLTILDVWGRTVWSKSVNPSKDKLTEVSWNGRSANGHVASAGMYIVRISALNAGVTTNYVRKSVTLRPR